MSKLKKERGGVIIIELVVAVLVGLAAGAGAGYVMRKSTAEKQIGSAEEEAKRIIKAAEDRGEAAKKEKLLEAKEDVHRLRQELDKETRKHVGAYVQGILAETYFKNKEMLPK